MEEELGDGHELNLLQFSSFAPSRVPDAPPSTPTVPTFLILLCSNLAFSFFLWESLYSRHSCCTRFSSCFVTCTKGLLFLFSYTFKSPVIHVYCLGIGKQSALAYVTSSHNLMWCSLWQYWCPSHSKQSISASSVHPLTIFMCIDCHWKRSIQLGVSRTRKGMYLWLIFRFQVQLKKI